MSHKTVTELFSYSGGATCNETTDLLNTYYHGWTLETSIDLLGYLEHHRTEGMEVFALVSIFKAFDAGQASSFITWSQGLLSGIVLDGKHQLRMDAINAPNNVECECKCRWLRKMLLEYTAVTDGDILTKCEELLGLL
jgi:hypothetical protein